jgi:glycosyltransferase involved in cell wall biosynthesis
MVRQKIPVIIMLTGEIGGPISWATRLRETLKNNSNYEILLVGRYIDDKVKSIFDLTVSDIDSVYNLLKSLEPAIIIPNWLWNLYPLCAKLAAKGKELRCIGFCRGDSEETYYRHLRKYAPIISHFIGVSPKCGEDLYRQFPDRTSDITVLPTAVFVPQNLTRTYHRNPIRIVYGGRIEQKQKRVMDFIPVIKGLLSRDLDFVFDIVGSGSYLLQFLEALQECKHGGRVRYLGRLFPEEMQKIWMEHDIFVQLSDSEGTSNSMLEAMACATVPLVTATSSGVEGVIDHKKNGFVVPIGSTDLVVDIIEELVNFPVLLEEVGTAAHRTTHQFSMSNYAKKFLSILDKVSSMPVRTVND